MRQKIINFLKVNPLVLSLIYSLLRIVFGIISFLIPIKKKTVMFASFGGRKFDDSPKAIYDEMLKREEFSNWEYCWAFVNPDSFDVPKGNKVKIDTPAFFLKLLTSQVWVSNTGIDRGIGIPHKRGRVRVETWHGTPLKKICGEENSGGLTGNKVKEKRKKDNKTIRCAQSEYDREIFQRLFNATKESLLLIDLPRNDSLLKYSKEDVDGIKDKLDIRKDKKVILYMPTYREYLLDENNDTYLAPPMDLKKWEEQLSSKYVVLMRAHYAVNKSLNLKENDFIKDVSNYPCLNDLYVLADVLVSDYSSAYFDYSILERPMLCFAYDLLEYSKKRGMYLDIEETLPCRICKNEDELISDIKGLDYSLASSKSKEFKERFAPYAGNSSARVVDEIIRRVKL